MADSAWKLETSLDRIGRFWNGETKGGYRRADCEEELIDSFQRASTVVQSPPAHDDRVSWLALMRHYGLPSRLLDCTTSPSVAAYFAGQQDLDCDLAIWAFDKAAFQRSAQASCGMLSPCTPLEFGDGAVFSATFSKSNPRRLIALVDAGHKSPRQEAQQGLFLCPGDVGCPFYRNLHGIPQESRTKGSIYKVVLPRGVRNEILADLKGLDLLPPQEEVEKLCTELKERLEQSQKNHGHFEWKVVVKPILKRYGLLGVELADH